MANRMRDDGHGVAIAGGFFRILLYVCVIFAIIYVGKTAYSFGYDIFNQVPVSQGEGKDVTVVIKDGTSVYKIDVYKRQQCNRLYHCHGSVFCPTDSSGTFNICPSFGPKAEKK